LPAAVKGCLFLLPPNSSHLRAACHRLANAFHPFRTSSQRIVLECQSRFRKGDDGGSWPEWFRASQGGSRLTGAGSWAREGPGRASCRPASSTLPMAPSTLTMSFEHQGQLPIRFPCTGFDLPRYSPPQLPHLQRATSLSRNFLEHPGQVIEAQSNASMSTVTLGE